MEDPVPIYVKHNDLPSGIGAIIPLELCQIINLHVPNQALGARLVRGIWTIWLKSIRAKQFIMERVKVLCINYVDIDIHDRYPSTKIIPNEKILFKDLPLNVSDNDILNFLNDQPDMQVKSKVIASRIRDYDNKLTPFYTGDRFVYVKGKFPRALPNNAMVNFNKCRVWHKSQEKACIRCRKFDHATTETDKCDAFSDDSNNIIAFRSPKHVLCNYYQSDIKVFGMEFPSVEHAFQWRFLKYVGMDEHAQEVLDTSSPAEAKEIASSIPRQLHKDWHAVKVCAMREILHAKADYCHLFRSTLIDSVGKRLVESTQDLFWASGLPPQFSSSTKSQYYPGRNELGHILESVRAELIKEAVLLQIVDTDDCAIVTERPSTVEQMSETPATIEPALMQPQTRESASQQPSTETQQPSSTQASDEYSIAPASDQRPTEPASEQPPTKSASHQAPTESASDQPQTVDSACVQMPAADTDGTTASAPISTSLDRKTLKAGKMRMKEKKMEITPTVLAMFEAMKKRKMSPEKEADSSQVNRKNLRRNSSSS